MQSWFAGHGWNSTALDWLTHGGSDQLEGQERLRRGITEVGREIDIACGTLENPPIVIAHSMGGLASLAYAAATTRELAALVLLTPVVPRAFGGAPIDIPVDFDTPWGPPPPDLARQLFYSGADDATASAYYQRLVPESPQAVWEATRWTVELELSPLRMPTLVVAAEADLLVPAEYVLAMAEGIGAESILLPGVGHGVTLDPGWPRLAAQIESWLTRVVIDSATDSA
jgi:pimeloyl-ACP methyl ester carboxylesterase